MTHLNFVLKRRWLWTILLIALPLVAQPKSLFDRLVSDDERVRAQAVQEAGNLEPAVRQQLIARLIATFPSKGLDSYFASLSLGGFGDAAVPSLIEAIRSPEPTIRYRASEALGAIGAPAFHPLLNLLHDSSPQARCAAASSLEHMQESAASAVPLLIPLLQSDSADQTRCVIQALGKIGSSDALAALRAELKVTAFQSETLNALAAMGHGATEATADVIPLLKSSKEMTRMIAARTLGQIAPSSDTVVNALIGSLSDPDWWTRQTAAEALGKFGPASAPAVPMLRQLLHPTRSDNDRLARLAAAETLGKIGPAAKDAVPDLIPLWLDEDRYTRQTAVEAVTNIGSSADPALISALASENPDIRRGAAWQLGEFHRADAVPALTSALRDKDATVQAAAKQALEKIATPEAKSALATFSPRPTPIPRRLTLAQIERSIPPAEGQRDASKLVSKVELKGPDGISLLGTLHRSDDSGDRLRIWEQVGDRYRQVYENKDSTEPGVAEYEQPEGFRLGGEYFIHLMLLYSGTASAHEDVILWIAPDSTLHPVKFVSPATRYPLGKGEGVWKGELNRFADDDASFRFGIWRDGDGNCCPTGGIVTGRYKLTGHKEYDPATKRWSANFSIMPVAFQRVPQ